MKFTIVIPVSTGSSAGFGAAEYIATFARTAEESGFYAVAISEHPAPSAKWLEHGGHESFDPFVALAYCAGVTTTLRLMPYLAVLPYRNPLLTAKAVATLDLLSRGRLILVAGAGYLRSEFRALGVDFDERHVLLDEALEVLTRTWMDSEIAYKGKHFEAIGQVSRPAPLQQPHPPLWIGGNTRQAQERAAKYGTGWAPIQMDPDVAATTRTAPLTTDADVLAAVERVRAFVRQRGGDDRSFTVQLDAKATNFLLKQPMEKRLKELRAFGGAGVDQCVVHVPTGDLATSVALVRQIGRDLVQPLSDASLVGR